MTTNQMNLTQLGLLNINRKIIDSRKYKENSVSTEGEVTIINGVASSFNEESYLYKNGIALADDSEVIINFSGLYLPSDNENAQTAWKIQGENTSVTLLVSNSEVSVLLDSTIILNTNSIPLNDNEKIKVSVSLRKNSADLTVYANDKVSQKSALITNPIELSTFTKLNIGNNPSDMTSFWRGSVELQNFSIMEDHNLLFTPSTNYSLTFSKILVSDGKFSLSNASVPILDHVLEFDVSEVTRSGNTVLLTAQITGETNIIIKEIGLYAETEEGPILFSKLDGLNIDTGKNVPYDLIFTVNMDISFVNAVGFPDTGSIILEESEPITFNDFNTVRDLSLYIFTSLERIIAMNAEKLGYNTPQVFYRLQQVISLTEESYFSIQTYVKLIKKLKRIVEVEIDPSLININGDVNITDGNATNFSNENYIDADIYLDTSEPWQLKTSFSAEGLEEGSIVTLGSPSKNQSVITSIVEDNEESFYNVKIEEQESLEATILSENVTYYRDSNNNKLTNITYYENPNDTVQINAENIATAFMDSYLTVPIPNTPIETTYEEVIKFRTPSLRTTSQHFAIQEGLNGPEIQLLATTSAMSISISMLQNGEFVDHEGLLQLNVQPFTEQYLRIKLNKINLFTYSISAELSNNGSSWSTPITTTFTTSGILTFGTFQFGGGTGYSLDLNETIITADDISLIKTSEYLQAWTTDEEVEAYNLHLANPELVSTTIVTPSTRPSDITWKHPDIQENAWNFSLRATTGNIGSSSTSKNYTSLAYGLGKFIAVSGWGWLVTSTDGGTWMSLGQPSEIKFTSGAGWVCAIFAEDKFTLLGTDGYISQSEDGVTWVEKAQLISHHSWKSIAYSETYKYVALNQQGYISTSSDGITWSTPEPNESLSNNSHSGWTSLIFNPITNLYTAVTIDGYVSTSADGETWSTPAAGADSGKSWRVLAFDGAKLILVDYEGYLSYSGTGEYWSTPILNPDLNANPYWASATYGNGKLILGAIADSGKLAVVSLDSWEQPALMGNISSPIVGASGTTNGDYLVGIDAQGNVKTSTTGNSWVQKIQLPLSSDTTNWVDIAAKSTDEWVATSNKSQIGLPGTVGGSWNSASQVANGTSWNQIAYGNGKYVAVSTNSRDKLVYDTTSSTWTTYSAEPLYSIAYDTANSRFVALGKDRAFYSTDGISWYRIESASITNGNMYSRLAYGNGKLVALSYKIDPDVYISTNGGSSWSSYSRSWQRPATTLKYSSLIFDGTNFVFLVYGTDSASNGVTYMHSSPDGLTWTTTELSDSILDQGLFEYSTSNQLGFTYGNGKYVLMAGNGNIATTTNLTSHWTFDNSQREKLGNNQWTSMAYNSTSNEFVALSSTGYISMSNSSSSDVLTPFSPYSIVYHKIIYCSFLNKYIAVSRRGNTYTSTDGRNWVEGGTLTGSSYWTDITCSDNEILVIGRNYLSTSTDGTTWTTPVSRQGTLVTKTNEQFVVANSEGYVAYSRDGEHWTNWEQNSTLQPSQNRFKWIASCYNNGKAYLFDNNGHFTTSSLPTASVGTPASIQYLIGKSSGSVNNSPFTLTLENAYLTLKPSLGTLYAWRNSTPLMLYTSTLIPSAGDSVFDENGSLIGVIQRYYPNVGAGQIIVYYNKTSATVICNRYATGDTQIPDVILTSEHSLKSNSTYDISISYDGSKYTLFYRLDPLDTGDYPDQETILYYSKSPVSLNKNSSLAIGSDNNSFKFMGTVDIANCEFISNGYNWIGATRLTSLLSKTIAPSSASELFDPSTYAIPEEVPCTLHEGTILNENLFEIEPNKKYNIVIEYTGTSYRVLQLENSRTGQVLYELDSDKIANTVNQIYIGAEPSYVDSTAHPVIGNPFTSGTVYLKNVSITQDDLVWAPTKEVVTHIPQLLQYYHIPKLNRSQYSTKDFCDFDRIITVLENTFTGNRDIINFANPNGFTLSVKANLRNSEPKILLAKSDSVSTPYFTLTFIENTLEFIIYGISNKVYKLSRKLEIEEISAFTSNPILLTVIYNPLGDTPTLSLYRNNDKVIEEIVYFGTLVEHNSAALVNYLPEGVIRDLCEGKETESESIDDLVQKVQDNVDFYIDGLIAVSGAISEEELYYITNLSDTNF